VLHLINQGPEGRNGDVKTIYKYPLEIREQTVLTLRGEVLSAGVQGDDIVVWAVYDDEVPERQVVIHVMGTGHPFVDAPESSFIGTVFLGVGLGQCVFHVFVTDSKEGMAP